MSNHASRAVAPNAQMHPGLLYRRFLQDLSSSLFSFVLPLLPTTEERAVKEEVRALIEKLVKTIEPSARLLAFGSSQNSFGLRNSDMDLVVLIDDPSAGLESSHLVQMIGDLLQRETNFDVKPLPKARIPILKLTLTPSPALPFGIACDIGIENRLAIENTRLLLTYATIDPARVRTLVLFLKVWAKRRRINSPYRGTLSSYGFTLMVLYFLVHVKQPPVLPNLQRIAPLRPLSEDDVMIQGRNVYFFDDTETLRQEWSSINFETVGELLIDFFRFFSHDFQFNNSVMSLRAGQLTKESKGWVNDIDVGGLNELARDRNRLCIEDPFEITYNVARTVTKDGLYTIRGEFMRATRILTQRPERAVLALAELCREREDDFRAPRSSSPAPRSMSTNRSGYSTPPIQGNPGWRSQSQVPFDRMNGPPHLEAPSSSRRGRRSEAESEPPSADYNHANSAQEMWLASQGNNLGNLGNLNLGLSFGESPYTDPSRGRDTASRGLETPGGYNRTPRRGNNYDHHAAGSGSISAPLSPHTMYAKLELGKPHAHIQPNPPNPAGAGASASGWPTGNFVPPNSSIPAPTGGSNYRTPAASQAPSRTGSIVPGSAHAAALEAYAAQLGAAAQGSSQRGRDDGQGLGLGGIGQEVAAAGTMSSFQPFSPANMPSSLLREIEGDGQAQYISPSTLLSPAPPAPQQLKGENTHVDGLVSGFEKMGVNPPGQGKEAEKKGESKGEEAGNTLEGKGKGEGAAAGQQS